MYTGSLIVKAENLYASLPIFDNKKRLALRQLQSKCYHFYEAFRKSMKSDVEVIINFGSKCEF